MHDREPGLLVVSPAGQTLQDVVSGFVWYSPIGQSVQFFVLSE